MPKVGPGFLQEGAFKTADMSGRERINTAVIGAGQAGLAMSYHLRRLGIQHMLFEARHRVGWTWQKRWDSFRLVTPNWMCQLPGFRYEGNDPDGFMSRIEVLEFIQRYWQAINAPVRFNTEIIALRRKPPGDGYCLETTTGTIEAANVVVATGGFQRPWIPPAAAAVARACFQVHSDEYQRPEQLAPGAVVVVGSGQSGAHIANELHQGGRHVYLCVSPCAHVPLEYRGQSLLRWFYDMYVWSQKNYLPRQHANEFGHRLDNYGKRSQLNVSLGQVQLRALGAAGITLAGRFEGISGGKIKLGGDLQDNLDAGDEFASMITNEIDSFIEKAALKAPPATVGKVDFEPREIGEINIDEERIHSIVWATGYRLDFRWIEVPVFNERGHPVHARGVTKFPGLYFIGLQWLHTAASSLMLGVGQDAAHIATMIAGDTWRQRNS